MYIFNAITNVEIIPRFFNKTGVKLNYLMAFDNLRNQTQKLTSDYRHMINLLYLESGGYRTRKGKANITKEKYLAFLQAHGHLFNQVFSLDDKQDDVSHNQANLDYLEQNLTGTGVKPLPVLHDPKFYSTDIPRLAAQGYDYLCLATPHMISDEVFIDTARDFPNMKFHLSGKLRRSILQKHRPYSADAANWIHSAVKGIIHYWHIPELKEYTVYVGGRERKTKTPVDVQNFHHKNSLEAFLSSTFNYSLADLSGSNQEARGVVNMYFYHQLETYLNRSS
jgi:hypothetical protein